MKREQSEGIDRRSSSFGSNRFLSRFPRFEVTCIPLGGFKSEFTTLHSFKNTDKGKGLESSFRLGASGSATIIELRLEDAPRHSKKLGVVVNR